MAETFSWLLYSFVQAYAPSTHTHTTRGIMRTSWMMHALRCQFQYAFFFLLTSCDQSDALLMFRKSELV